MTLLTLENLGVTRGRRQVLTGVNLTVAEGELVGLIGPNGAGKTTLLRAALGLQTCTGRSSLTALAPREKARAAAFLPQAREIAWPVSVEVLVALGRSPHLGAAARMSAADRAAVENALKRMDITHLRDRPATELSGGEAARALIARVLAQETPLILADEPTAGLDPAAQIATLEVFAGLARDGRAVLASLHDLGLAARHCTRLVVLSQGRVVADGPPDAVLTPKLLDEVFGVVAHLESTANGLVFQPLRAIRR